jgi:hypothetical protein
VFLEEHDSFLHGLNSCNGVSSDHFNISEMLHDLHESIFLLLGLTAFWEIFNTLLNPFDERLDIVDLSGGVLK